MEKRKRPKGKKKNRWNNNDNGGTDGGQGGGGDQVDGDTPTTSSPKTGEMEAPPRGQEGEWQWHLTWMLVTLAVFLLFGMAWVKWDFGTKVHVGLIAVKPMLPKGFVDWMESFHVKSRDAADGDVDGSSEDKSKKGVHNWLKGPSKSLKLKLFSLRNIEYKKGGKMYLVLLGHVFDVTGAEVYEAGSGYHAFIGRDSSRSFVTGDFSEGNLTDDVEGLQAQDYIGLADWLKFYLEHDKYRFVGYLKGKYFDDLGKETPAMGRLKELVQWAMQEKEKEGDLLKVFPTCNVDWKANAGTTLWCSSKSGGVDRNWVGYPRKFFESPNKSPRCACVPTSLLSDPRVQPYDGCDAKSESCRLPETDSK